MSKGSAECGDFEVNVSMSMDTDDNNNGQP